MGGSYSSNEMDCLTVTETLWGLVTVSVMVWAAYAVLG